MASGVCSFLTNASACFSLSFLGLIGFDVSASGSTETFSLPLVFLNWATSSAFASTLTEARSRSSFLSASILSNLACSSANFLASSADCVVSTTFDGVGAGLLRPASILSSSVFASVMRLAFNSFCTVSVSAGVNFSPYLSRMASVLSTTFPIFNGARLKRRSPFFLVSSRLKSPDVDVAGAATTVALVATLAMFTPLATVPVMGGLPCFSR